MLVCNLPLVRAHRASMSEDEEVAIAHAFVTEVGNGVRVVMDLVIELDMDHFDNSRDNEPMVFEGDEIGSMG